MRELLKKESLKARMIGGTYFQDLMAIFKNILTKKGSSLRNKYVIETYFLGNKFAVDKLYNDLGKKYGENDFFNFNGILFPYFSSFQVRGDLVLTWLDFIYPYLFNNYDDYLGEGPYLYKNIQIKKGDIVIDAGANLGLFSALASHLGTIVYAFEPVKEIRDNYLLKTVELNKNIVSVPYALSNKKELINIRGNAIGNASIVIDRTSNGEVDIINEYVQAISLDEWVKENNIPRIDFIKADIEGAERLMIEGAQQVLKEYAPKLAICTYHLSDDKEVLTKLILQANPHYKIEYKWKKLYASIEN